MQCRLVKLQRPPPEIRIFLPIFSAAIEHHHSPSALAGFDGAHQPGRAGAEDNRIPSLRLKRMHFSMVNAPQCTLGSVWRRPDAVCDTTNLRNPKPGWRNWQTQRTQNPPRFTPRGGSTPPPGTTQYSSSKSADESESRTLESLSAATVPRSGSLDDWGTFRRPTGPLVWPKSTTRNILKCSPILELKWNAHAP